MNDQIRLSPKEAGRYVEEYKRADIHCPHCGSKNLSFTEKGEPCTEKELKDSWLEQTCLDCNGKCQHAFHITIAYSISLCGKGSCDLCENYYPI